MGTSTTADELRREQQRDRSEAFRDRRRHGVVLVQVEVAPKHLAGLERLGILRTHERADKASVAQAVARFLNAAPGVAAVGDGLWPADEEERDDDDDA